MRPPESFVGQPIRSLQTMLQVIAQNDESHPSVIPDGIYGPETMQAVAVFQRKHMLPVTGIADLSTWETIIPVYECSLARQYAASPIEVVWNPGTVIHNGQTHPNLFLAQGMLAVMADVYHSVSKPSLTGVLDEITADSISSFQMLSGLPVTGNLDRVTWEHLSRQYPLAAHRTAACQDVSSIAVTKNDFRNTTDNP